MFTMHYRLINFNGLFLLKRLLKGGKYLRAIQITKNTQINIYKHKYQITIIINYQLLLI